MAPDYRNRRGSKKSFVKPRPLNVADIERVVVRGTNWVGDSIMTIPALRELRRILPSARITLATRSWSKGLFEDADFVDDIMLTGTRDRSFGTLRREISDWRAGNFDLAVMFTNSFQSAFVANRARIKHRIGYATEKRGFLLTRPVKVPDWHNQSHEVFYYLNIISELESILYGSSQVFDHEPISSLPVGVEKLRTASDVLTALGLPVGKRLVMICPGSTNSRAKRWPSDRFAAVADMVVNRLNAAVIFVGAPDELEVTNEVVSLMKNPAFVLTGKTDISELAPILSLADVVVTNDTGPAHIAAALNRPTVVIFGPTDPVTTRPYSANSIVVREPPDCAPCMLRDCPIDHRCMTRIDPEAVQKIIAGMLEATSTLVSAEVRL
jgi:heptosyltransferase-2